MEKIIIELDNSSVFKVFQGNRESEGVTYGEALEIITQLMLREVSLLSLQWMRTKEEHRAWRASWHHKEDNNQELINNE